MGALAIERYPNFRDLADLGAGDAYLLVLDEEARIVEDRANQVLVAGVLGGARPDEEERPGGDEGGEDAENAPHGSDTDCSGMTASGSQLPLTSFSTNGVEPSSAGCDAVPGQRWKPKGLKGFGNVADGLA